MFDSSLVGGNFIDFYNNDVKLHSKLIKSLGYINYGSDVRCYHFGLMHSITGYNRMAIYVNADNMMIKTFLFMDNEVSIMTEKEEWMNYLHLKKGTFVEDDDFLNRPKLVSTSVGLVL